MQNEVSLPSSQKPAILNYPDSDESKPRPPIFFFFNVHFNLHGGTVHQ